MPISKGGKLIRSHDEIKLRGRVFLMKRGQRVDGKSRPSPPELPIVNNDSGKIGEGQSRHRKPVFGCAQPTRLVPRDSGRHHMQLGKPQLCQSNLRQADVRIVRRVKRAPKNTDTKCNSRQVGRTRSVDMTQSQSRRTMKSRYSAASAEPTSTGRWYDQLARGGIDIRIDSVRPPDCKPKCVPRSQTRLNST